ARECGHVAVGGHGALRHGRDDGADPFVQFLVHVVPRTETADTRAQTADTVRLVSCPRGTHVCPLLAYACSSFDDTRPGATRNTRHHAASPRRGGMIPSGRERTPSATRAGPGAAAPTGGVGRRRT